MSPAVSSSLVERQPRLLPGKHQDPDDGVCLMEYVSMLSGHRFSDAPGCTDPLLAELARLVNDTIGEEARSGLTRLAGSLVALPARSGSAAAPAIVVAALDAVLRVRPDRRDLLRHRRRAMRSAPRSGLLENLRSTLYRHGPARHALSRAVYVAAEHVDPGTGRDAVLAAMLEDAVTAAGEPVRA